MYTYAIWNKKGGVGKTTCTVNLAYAMGIYGKRVLVIDLDPQVNTTPFFVKDAFLSVSIYDVLQGCAKCSHVIQKTRYPFVDIIKGNLRLANTGEDISRLYHALQGLPYDIVLIDCNPSYDYLSKSALCAADEVLVPILLDGYCKDNLTSVNSAYLEALEYNENLVWNVFANRVRNNKRQRTIYQDLVLYHQYPLYETCISDRPEVQITSDKKKPVLKSVSKSIAANDFRDLAQEILQRSEERRCVNGNV